LLLFKKLPYFGVRKLKLKTKPIFVMKRTKSILLGVVFLSALAFASCGAKQAKEGKECKEGEKKECCEKKDSTAACCEKKDSTACASADSTKKVE